MQWYGGEGADNDSEGIGNTRGGHAEFTNIWSDILVDSMKGVYVGESTEESFKKDDPKDYGNVRNKKINGIEGKKYGIPKL